MANVSSSNGLEKYPKLRFKGFSEPWEHVKLSDFVSRVTRKNSDNQTDIPLTISSKDGLINQNEFFSKQVASKDMSGYYLLQRGEFAYNKSYSVGFDFGSIKRLEKYDQGALSTLYICFALNRFDSDFIKHYFDSLKWYREIYMISAEGARNHGLLNVPTEDFFATLHTLPMDTAEQRKIAEFLDLLTSKIEKQQSLVDNLKKYKRGVYKSIFATSRLDCKWVSLGELCEIITKGTTPQSFLSEGTIRYIKIESIVDGHIINENCKFIDRTTHEGTLSRSVLKEGDILFSIAGSLGVCVIVQQSNLPANTNQALAIIRLKEAENRNYILSVLRSSLMEEYILASRTTGAQPNLSLQQMRDFKLPYPNADEQQKIALFAEMMEKRLNSEQRKLEKLLDVKSALLQQLFI